mmetsp:Transcript_38175/g.105230  ORF Transcript_38175/g.105230 Transcript_38175/m.105230 type:complete len:401 (-) Transcript_38175:248-1450(-)
MNATSLLASVAAAICFGIQYVPVKKYEVYDGATFQWFMCSGIFMASSMIGLACAITNGDEGVQCPMEVAFGGMLWATSNYAVIPLVKLLGLGVGFSMYHFVNLIGSYMIGRLGIFGIQTSQPADVDVGLWPSDLGVVIVSLSFIALVFVESGDTAQPQTEAQVEFAGSVREGGLSSLTTESLGESSSRMAVGCATSGFGFQDDVMQRSKTARSLSQGERSARSLTAGDAVEGDEVPEGNFARATKRTAGIVLALVGGGLAAVNSVPATLYNDEHNNKAQSPLVVVFPQGLGIWVMSSFIYLGYATIARLRGVSVQHSVIRPACLSGGIWGVGFCLMVIGINGMGFSIGYSLDAVGPIIVSSLLSLLVYQEVTDYKHIAIYCAAEVAQLVGVVLIAAFSSQ